MNRGLDKALEAMGRVADTAAQTTMGLMAKGKGQLDRIALEKQLAKAHRQLGRLLYTLRKTGDSKEALIARYVEEIDRIEDMLAVFQPETDPVKVHYCSSCGVEVKKGAMFCSCCGEKLP